MVSSKTNLLLILLEIYSIFKKIMLLCTLVFFLWVPSFAADLPDLGSPTSLILSTQEEQHLARSILGELRRSLLLAQDPIVDDYLYTIGYRILATHKTDPTSYTFFAVNDNSINAFAVPGGMIGVNHGLILAAGSESELAGVLAHEIAHVHLKHIARFIEHMGRVKLSNIAGILASLILATQNSQAGTGALAATMAGSTQSLINFTRENEKEADFIGIQSLADAGFDPQGMGEFFHNLNKKTRYSGRNVPEYLRTHPLTENRLMEANQRAKNFPYKQIPDSLQFYLIQARVKVATFASAAKAVEYFAKTLKNKTYRNEQGAKYGYALALLEAGQHEESLKVLDDLIQNNANQVLYHLAWASAQWQINQKPKALERLKATLKNHPQHHPTVLAIANMYLSMQRNQEAIKLLHRQSLERSKDPEIYHLLSKAYNQMHDPIASHRFEAEYRYHLGDLQGALTQLRMAENHAGSTTLKVQPLRSRREEIQKIIAENQKK